MKNILLATVIAFGLVGTAMAADPVKADRTNVYVGGFIGSSTEDHSRTTVGLVTGVQYGSFVRTEADLDRAWRSNGKDGYRITLNVIGQYRVPNSVVTPYVIVGAGYALDGLASVKDKNGQTPIWNAGVGTRVGLSESTELDLRYREVRPFNDDKTALKQDHVFTAGLNYRF